MDDSLLGLLGLCKKAGKLELGDEPVSIAAREHRARLILMASDAGDVILRKGAGLSTDNCPALAVPFTKAQLGSAVGRSACALLCVTEVGFASALVKKLAQADPGQYGDTAQRLNHKAEKALRRRREKQADKKEREANRRKPWAPPTKK